MDNTPLSSERDVATLEFCVGRGDGAGIATIISEKAAQAGRLNIEESGGLLGSPPVFYPSTFHSSTVPVLLLNEAPTQ